MDEDNKIIRRSNNENYYCYDWFIKLHCLCRKCLEDYYIVSPEFITETILAGNCNVILSNFLGSELNLTMQTETQLNSMDNFNLRISVKRETHLECHSREYKINLKYDSFLGLHCDHLKFINFSLINNCTYFISKRVLTLFIEIFKPVIVKPTNVIRNTTNIEKALKTLQLSEELSDVTLVAGEREFRVHKVILATQSSVFLAMFKHDVKETNENRVVIEDVSERVMEQVLDYIYGGSMEKENFEVLASDVLVAADKYNLQGLVRICEDSLISSLDADNVLKILTTSEVYKLNSLKRRALNFIRNNVKIVVETDEFKRFLDSSNHCLMKEIILAINNKLS